MKIEVSQGDITTTDVDGILVGLCENSGQLGPATSAVAAVDALLGGAIGTLLDSKGARGKAGEVTVLHTLGRLPCRLVAVCGLGPRSKVTTGGVRDAVAEGSRALRKLGATSMATTLIEADAVGLDDRAVARAIAEGAILGLYSFLKYKLPEVADMERLVVVVRNSGDASGVQEAVATAVVLAEATNLARDMVNEPANYMTPSRMAEMALDLGSTYGFEVTVLGKEEMATLGMGALLGVASGSAEAPKFIRMDYTAAGGDAARIALVGKAITFDSGGISIKPSEGLAEMKDDMAGGAAVIATMSAVARAGAPANVTGLVPATENLLGSRAYRPGDVLRAMNGKTIEVISTDAEGRLALADAISYAVKEGLAPLVDVATLTGACQVALGKTYSGVFSNNQELADRFLGAAARAGERMWQLPLADEYRDMNKSLIADIKNVGNRHGGAITAALFISEFTGDVPWLHVDIAGTSNSAKDNGVIVKGATGVAVRTMYELVRSS